MDIEVAIKIFFCTSVTTYGLLDLQMFGFPIVSLVYKQLSLHPTKQFVFIFSSCKGPVLGIFSHINLEMYSYNYFRPYMFVLDDVQIYIKVLYFPLRSVKIKVSFLSISP